jgi:hypothetical protein
MTVVMNAWRPTNLTFTPLTSIRSTDFLQSDGESSLLTCDGLLDMGL